MKYIEKFHLVTSCVTGKLYCLKILLWANSIVSAQIFPKQTELKML
ncbi:hypothetical protein VIAE109791_04710 [Vibrio aestuarianus subsp. francensis]